MLAWHVPALANDDVDSPRAMAALAQGSAAETGRNGVSQPWVALALYCDAGMMGSVEGYYRVGLLLRKRNAVFEAPALANAYLALAASLGHERALQMHNPAIADVPVPDQCGDFALAFSQEPFDLRGHLAALPAGKRRIAALIDRNAPRYDIDAHFALAIALAESNLDHLAVSPKNAQGVMQLIPDTQERFGVRRPFDPESNIRGALSYLRWLTQRFNGDLALVAAAYNAGEGVVESYKGIPPYPETRQYVRRVLYLSGLSRRTN